MGHPLIKLKSLNQTHISISQKHFLFDNTIKPVETKYNYKWFVPFTYAVERIDAKNTSFNQVNMNNLHDKIIWLNPNETESEWLIDL